MSRSTWLPLGFRLPLAFLMVLGACGGEAGRDPGQQDASGETFAHTNHLINEKSPYLLQHAHNPVDWYPWGDEAFAKARREDKPIFLSVGYSTCHWCHVMERESFENEAIAGLLNADFVSVKVDREERPVVDALYMTAVQAMNRGRGGWPMTLILTPDLKPFFAGTYLPPEQLERLLRAATQSWRNDRPRLEEQSDQVAAILARQAAGAPSDSSGSILTASLLDAGFRGLRTSFDPGRGGFGTGQKFPTPHRLAFLLRYAERTGDADALGMVRKTLDAMAAGGIHDHLGGGFHRYSTDPDWLVPHFEKMLYDQAGLALVYTEASLVFPASSYEATARDVLDYVLRDLLQPGGGFASAEDADSEGEEGKFYVWSAAEIDSTLGADEGPAFREAYQATATGNWEGENILHPAAYTLDTLARWRGDREKLLAVRSRRVRPLRDDKVITAWNGSMIEALARAGAAFDEPRYVRAAERAASFVQMNLFRDGRLLRHYKDGAADMPAVLDDYAGLGSGLLALYEATFDPAWLAGAVKVTGEMNRLFIRPEGGYTMAGTDADTLLAPVVEASDGATASGNAVAALLDLRLGHLTANLELEAAGRRALAAFAEPARRSPDSHLGLLSALDFALGPRSEIVVAGDPEDSTVAAMCRAFRERYLPNTVAALRPANDAASVVALIPYLEAQSALDGRATGYVCRDYACRLPVHDVGAFVRELDDRR